jgi:tetratricopeptide (TPR) repeat protein
MARSIGIPTRSTSGWVYLGDEELLFGYHAWNEVAIEGNWVSVDATWGELYPNATHIKMEIEEADHRFARKVDDGELVFKVVRVKSAPDVRLKASNEQIRKYPGEPAWLEARASLYMDLERYSEAIRDLNAAIKLAPDIAEYHEFLAMGYEELDEGAKAIAAQGQAAKLSPNHPGYWHDLAWLQMREGAYGDAIASVNKALELRPDNIEYLDSRSYFHYGRNDHKAALADIERAIAITASDPMLHTTRGMILLGAKSYGEAEKAFTQGIQLDPADPWLLIHRATARDHLKDPKGAREDLMKALMIKDLDADATSEIRDMLSVLRDSEPARP